MSGDKTVLLAAGGTGGHVFPALALGQALRARGYQTHLATDGRGMKFSAHFAGVTPHVLSGAGLSGNPLRKALSVLKLGIGYLQALWLLLRLKPVAVVGFGGYPSAPPMLAAQHLGIPTLLHEANAVLGKANVFLARNVTTLALSWPPESPLPPRLAAKMVVTGNPVRAEIEALRARPYPEVESDGMLHVLVWGGSLGAGVFSRVVPAALAMLPAADRARLSVVQQVRADDLDTVRASYDQAGIRARLAPFFDDVPDLLAHAHLVIGRSGASTVAELAAAGRPSILVPYPHHADRQQFHNASVLTRSGAGWCYEEKDFTQSALLTRMESILHGAESLQSVAESARNCGQDRAADTLAGEVEKLARQGAL